MPGVRLLLLLGVALLARAHPADVNPASNSHGSYPRRTYQGRPFKAIIVTSKPLGYTNTKEDNVIRNRPTTPAPVSVTTESSNGYKIPQPTIPFFSISCSVGSSCSQIISARKVPTPKPTFKPYTKEDREKVKLAYSQLFGPTALLAASLTTNKLATTTTSTTTSKPVTSSIWRIRTTTATPKPVTSAVWTTTKSRPTLSSAIKEFAINSALESVSKWKWPSETINRNTMVVQSNPMKLAVPVSTSKPVKNAPFSPVAFDNSNNNKNGASMSKWLSSLIVASLNNAIAQKKNVPHVDQQKHHYKPHVQNNEIKVNRPTEPANSEPVQQLIGKEVINTKGHKTTIITGSSVRQQIKNQQLNNNNNQNVKLPPEFTVSSHGIRLQVAPKSRGSRFIQNHQGIDIETDGADVNLSDLIMKHYPVVPKRF